jgi:hypothetical protein
MRMMPSRCALLCAVAPGPCRSALAPVPALRCKLPRCGLRAWRGTWRQRGRAQHGSGPTGPPPPPPRCGDDAAAGTAPAKREGSTARRSPSRRRRSALGCTLPCGVAASAERSRPRAAPACRRAGAAPAAAAACPSEAAAAGAWMLPHLRRRRRLRRARRSTPRQRARSAGAGRSTRGEATARSALGSLRVSRPEDDPQRCQTQQRPGRDRQCISAGLPQLPDAGCRLRLRCSSVHAARRQGRRDLRWAELPRAKVSDCCWCRPVDTCGMLGSPPPSIGPSGRRLAELQSWLPPRCTHALRRRAEDQPPSRSAEGCTLRSWQKPAGTTSRCSRRSSTAAVDQAP